MTTSYTTWGPVTGSCDHRHRTPAAAFRCATKFRRKCEQNGSVSDRQVYRVSELDPPRWAGQPGTLIHYGEDEATAKARLRGEAVTRLTDPNLPCPAGARTYPKKGQ